MPHLSGRRTSRGFTLIEVMVSLTIFSVVMLACSQVFINAFSGYRDARAVQRDIENAQFAMNLLAKELRTSSIVASSGSHVKFYEHSQGICFDYQLSGGVVTVAQSAADDVADCTAMSLGSPVALTTGTVSGSFDVIPSRKSPPRVGRVTVYLEVQVSSTDRAEIQTTASLRDYGTF